MTTPEPEVRVTRYEVSCLPPDDVNARIYTIVVERHVSDGMWSANEGYFSLDADGDWREDPSKILHRHDEQTALDLAKRAAPLMRHFTGKTVGDALASRAAGR